MENSHTHKTQEIKKKQKKLNKWQCNIDYDITREMFSNKITENSHTNDDQYRLSRVTSKQQQTKRNRKKITQILLSAGLLTGDSASSSTFLNERVAENRKRIAIEACVDGEKSAEFDSPAGEE